MSWSPQQDAAIRSVSGWLADPKGPQVYRLFGYAGTGKTTLAKELAGSVKGKVLYATFTGKAALVLRKKGCEGEYFVVTNEGRAALAAHLKAIGDKHRRWIVPYAGYEMEVIATSAAKARYRKWLAISDVNESLTFGEFQRNSKVRAA